MSELDRKVDTLKKEFDKGKKSGLSPEAMKYHSRIHRAKKRGDMALAKRYATEAKKFPSANFEDPNFKKLTYVRYADD